MFAFPVPAMNSVQIVFQFGKGIVEIHVMLLEKGMHLYPRLKSQHLADLRFRELFRTVAFQSQRLERGLRRTLSFRGQVFGNFVGHGEGNLHTLRIAETIHSQVGGPV